VTYVTDDGRLVAQKLPAMKTWILILTIIEGNSGNGPTPVMSVPNFTTLEACQAAGKQWARDMAPHNDPEWRCKRTEQE
jgi:hypothetical protein